MIVVNVPRWLHRCFWWRGAKVASRLAITGQPFNLTDRLWRWFE